MIGKTLGHHQIEKMVGSDIETDENSRRRALSEAFEKRLPNDEEWQQLEQLSIILHKIRLKEGSRTREGKDPILNPKDVVRSD